MLIRISEIQFIDILVPVLFPVFWSSLQCSPTSREMVYEPAHFTLYTQWMVLLPCRLFEP